MKKTKRSLLAVLATAFVAVLALVCVLGFAACGEKTETFVRVTGSADTTVNFTFDDSLMFNDSSVTAEYDEDTNTYTLSGTSVTMSSDQINAFWGAENASDHSSAAYIGFVINLQEGETAVAESYKGDGTEADKTLTFSYGDDTSILLDTTDASTWSMVVTVSDSTGVVDSFTIVTGTLTPASAAAAE